MPNPDHTTEHVPASVEISYEPRVPETDPTLGVAVSVDRSGTPANRLPLRHSFV